MRLPRFRFSHLLIAAIAVLAIVDVAHALFPGNLIDKGLGATYGPFKKKLVIPVHGTVTCLAWSPDGTKLATISDWGGLVSVFDSSGHLLRTFDRKQTLGPYLFKGIAFAPDSETVITPAPNSTIEEANSALVAWPLANKAPARLAKGLVPTNNMVDAVHFNEANLFAVSANLQFALTIPGASVALNGVYAEVLLYSVNDFKVRRIFRQEDISVASNNQNPYFMMPMYSVAAAARDLKFAVGVLGGVVLIDADAEQPYRFIKPYDGNIVSGALAFSRDGRYLAVGEGLGFGRPQLVETRQNRESWAPMKVWDFAAAKVVFADPGATTIVRQVAWSPGDTYLASANDDNTVRVFTWPSSRSPVAVLHAAASIYDLAFSPTDGRLAVSAGDKVEVWDSSP